MLRCRSIPVALCFLLLALVPTAYAAKNDPEPIVVKDPHYGEVLFHFYKEDYFRLSCDFWRRSNRVCLASMKNSR